jgi:WD40 repeat protein
VIDLEQEKVIASTKSGIVWCSVLLRGATHLGLPPAVVIVGTGNSQISICDLDSLQVLMELKGHAGMVRSLTVSHGSSSVHRILFENVCNTRLNVLLGTVLVSSANTDGRIICWSLKSKTVIREIQVSTAANFSTPSIVCMANHMISVHTDGTLRAWSSVQS